MTNEDAKKIPVSEIGKDEILALIQVAWEVAERLRQLAEDEGNNPRFVAVSRQELERMSIMLKIVS